MMSWASVETCNICANQRIHELQCQAKAGAVGADKAEMRQKIRGRMRERWR